MKLFKSLLLGSAAGLVAISGASAADLGVKKPAPVEYVKVCSAHGAGFFYIPGSDVCMQISGRVRAEYLYATPTTRGDDVSSFRGHGRINVDTRQTTEYGLLRAFVRIEGYQDTGRYGQSSGAGVNGQGAAAAGASLIGTANNAQDNMLDKAFIQFYTGTAGFFTAGKATSFFDFYANNDNYTRQIGSDRNALLMAYTLTFGGGFSATLSVEDTYYRRVNSAAVALAPGLVTGNYTGLAGTTAVYGGQHMPDVVANLRVDQSWGSAQLSGVVHQLFLSNLYGASAGTTVIGAGSTPIAGFATAPYADTGYGYAVQGGVKVNLPMLAAGDYFYLQAAYGKGANDFVGVTRAVNDAAAFGNARNSVARTDGYVDSVGNVKMATSWSVVASLVHNFTPTIQGAAYASYGKVSYDGGGSNRAPATVLGAPLTSLYLGTRSGFVDFSAFQVGARINWIPVRNFTIGTEVVYSKLDPSGRVVDVATNPVAPTVAVGKTKSSFDVWTARLRFQRDF